MRESAIDARQPVRITIPPEIKERFAETRDAILDRTVLLWGEHCTECAFPSCYSSCEFFVPRADMNCRRFQFGIEIETDDVFRLMQIEFRRWAKLQGRGPARLFSRSEAENREVRKQILDKALTAIPLPKRQLNAAIRRINNYHTHPAPAAGKALRVASFIVEVWLETAPPIPLTLTIVPSDGSVRGLFQERFTVRCGYTRVVIPVSRLAQSINIDESFFVQIQPLEDRLHQPIRFGIVDFCNTKHILLPVVPNHSETSTTQPVSKTKKCVVWDLDDTLWSGTLAEDGLDGITIKPELVEAIKLLDARGILNSVASKNDEELARAALQQFGLSQYMLFPQINWGPKSTSIRRIADELNLGIDSFVFVDDQAFERAEVMRANPEIIAMAPNQLGALHKHPLFDVPITAESS